MLRLDLRESISMALGALRANKLRSFLTLLGVSIGVFSFIGVMTGIEVLQGTIISSFNVLGANTINVQKYPAFHGGPDTFAKYRNRKDITVDEGMYVREHSRLAQYVAVTSGAPGAQARYRNRKTNPDIRLRSGTPEIFQTFNLELGSGRIFTEQEMNQGKDLVIIGPGLVKTLFQKEIPLQKQIRIDGYPYTVIGVTSEMGGLFGSSWDNVAVVPITSFTQNFGKSRWVGIQAKAASQEILEEMTDEVIGLLRTARRVPPGEENDFEIVSNESLITEVNKLTLMIRIGTGAVSAIALLAAGIGIMNIMLVSVTERTREIGIRKAVGATKRSILRQFLIEAVVICEFGGLIGVALGLGGGNVVAYMLEIPAVLPIGWAALGLIVTSFIGIIFGVYPAWKASNLDPIEALRYE